MMFFSSRYNAYNPIKLFELSQITSEDELNIFLLAILFLEVHSRIIHQIASSTKSCLWVKVL